MTGLSLAVPPTVDCSREIRVMALPRLACPAQRDDSGNDPSRGLIETVFLDGSASVRSPRWYRLIAAHCARPFFLDVDVRVPGSGSSSQSARGRCTMGLREGRTSQGGRRTPLGP